MDISEKNQLALYAAMFQAMRDRIRMVMATIGHVQKRMLAEQSTPEVEELSRRADNLKSMLGIQEEGLAHYQAKLEEGSLHDDDAQFVLTAHRNANMVMERLDELLETMYPK